MNTQTSILKDAFGRRFRYLRLSVTEVCNFRCTYCLPNGFRKTGPLDFLSSEEIGRLAKALAGLGITKIRLTGGEPGVRKDLTSLISNISSQERIKKVALTTNGWNLSKHVDEWVAAGLTNLNISLDSLDEDAFAKITGHDRLRDVLEGLDKAAQLPLKNIKVNSVLLKDGFSQGLADWFDFVRDRDVSVRFIELMRTGDNKAYFESQHISGDTVRGWLDKEGWEPLSRRVDDGPANEYSHPDYAGRIGLIAPYSKGFCDGCNRLRVTARGRLRLCLFGQGEMDLRDYLQSDDQLEDLQRYVMEALILKPKAHKLSANDPGNILNLAQTGG